ncbi:hypothetical protein [Planktotalea sp.]|uniref:hypothetical protein n=1 Tax=Planktotalea sp. TaxID=2029877 RepID=UPI0035C87990
MKRDKWAQLARLSDLIFDVEAQKFARLQEEVAKLKQKRDRLEEMNSTALNAFNQGHTSLRMDGDFHWQTWVGNNASRLGQAQARARLKRNTQASTAKSIRAQKCFEEPDRQIDSVEAACRPDSLVQHQMLILIVEWDETIAHFAE